MEEEKQIQRLWHRFWERLTKYYYLEEIYYAFYFLLWLSANMNGYQRNVVQMMLAFVGFLVGVLGLVVLIRHVVKKELGQHLLCVQVWKNYAHSPFMRIAVVLAAVLFLYASRLSEMYVGSPSAWTFVLGGFFTTLFFHRSVDIVTMEMAIRQILLGQKVNLPLRTSADLREDLEAMEALYAQREAALRAGMRAEKLKTQLITNVSHDLKTPLTSIINYTDLLQDDMTTEEERKEYLEILSRNAQRMTTLINDIVLASRADTGNVETRVETLELNELLLQCYSFVDNRFGKEDLEFVFKPEREEIFVLADGSHLSRVVDNLLVNITKYAMAGTRVYAYTAVEDGVAKVVLKNTSRDALNISVEELRERFIRGDQSRHSEGSGLGLSIADSLMKLMGGELRLAIDADLFTATLIVPLAPAVEREGGSATETSVDDKASSKTRSAPTEVPEETPEKAPETVPQKAAKEEMTDELADEDDFLEFY